MEKNLDPPGQIQNPGDPVHPHGGGDRDRRRPEVHDPVPFLIPVRVGFGQLTECFLIPFAICGITDNGALDQVLGKTDIFTTGREGKEGQENKAQAQEKRFARHGSYLRMSRRLMFYQGGLSDTHGRTGYA